MVRVYPCSGEESVEYPAFATKEFKEYLNFELKVFLHEFYALN